MTKFAAALLILLVGCASTPKVAPVIPAPRHPELRELPADPRTEPLPDGFSGPEWAEPQEAGACRPGGAREPEKADPGPCPARAGVLVSEAKAARIKLYQIRYEELRTTYEADRTVWQAQRELYDAEIARRDKYIEDSKPSWWEENRAEFYGIGGMLLGATITILISHAVNDGSK